MSIIDIILLPFVFIYRGFIKILLLPYYVVDGLAKLFTKKTPNNTSVNNTNKKNIAEIKTTEQIKVVEGVRSAYDKPRQVVETDPVKIAANKKQRTLKQQQEFEKMVAKAKKEEEKRIAEQEKVRLEKLKKFNEKKQKEQEKTDKLNSELAKEEAESNNKEELSFVEKIKAFWQKLTLTEKKQLEYEAKKEVLEEMFRDKTVNNGRLNEAIIFNYLARNPKGEIEKSSIEALSRVDVHSFLIAEGYEVYEIVPANSVMTTNISSYKLKTSRLIFYLSQLSAYLKSGISLADSVKILINQTKNKNEKNTWHAVYYDITMGDKLSLALEKRKNAFPKLLVNMIKAAEMTGDLTDTLDDMVDYYTETENTRKQMISSMTYPAVVSLFAFCVVIFMFIYVVPSFADIYDNLGGEIPTFTKIVMLISAFLQEYIWYIILVAFIIIFTFAISYKRIRSFKKVVQDVLMHIPVIGNVIIYSEITVFSKTLANLINHNVFITDTMDVLNKITENEIYKSLIAKTMKNISKGEPISKAFKDHWAFPNIGYQMLITGEKTGRLGPMMERVSNYYQEQQRNIINQIKSLVEPVLIVFLAAVVGCIILAVIIPMFGLFEQIS